MPVCILHGGRCCRVLYFHFYDYITRLWHIFQADSDENERYTFQHTEQMIFCVLKSEWLIK